MQKFTEFWGVVMTDGETVFPSLKSCDWVYLAVRNRWAADSKKAVLHDLYTEALAAAERAKEIYPQFGEAIRVCHVDGSGRRWSTLS